MKPTHWKGRKIYYAKGAYPRVTWRGHPMAGADGLIRLHRLVLAESLGRMLLPSEVVHHKDGDIFNWDVANLELTTHREHGHTHYMQGDMHPQACGPQEKRECAQCKAPIFESARRAALYQRSFCNNVCFAKFQERAAWPTREALAKLALAHPVTQIAAQLGVTDQAVHKRCKKLGIATLPRGAWQKLRAGKL